MKMCAQGKARLYPSHGLVRLITSHSPLPCEKRSAWGGGWVYRLRSCDPHYQKGRGLEMDWAPQKLHRIHWFASILPQYVRTKLLRERGPELKSNLEYSLIDWLTFKIFLPLTHDTFDCPIVLFSGKCCVLSYLGLIRNFKFSAARYLKWRLFEILLFEMVFPS